VTISGDVLLSGSEDQRVLVWSLPDCQLLHALPTAGFVHGFSQLSPCTLITASGDRALRVWDVGGREEEEEEEEQRDM
jgi:WD40 repeat protein